MVNTLTKINNSLEKMECHLPRNNTNKFLLNKLNTVKKENMAKRPQLSSSNSSNNRNNQKKTPFKKRFRRSFRSAQRTKLCLETVNSKPTRQVCIMIQSTLLNMLLNCHLLSGRDLRRSAVEESHACSKTA